MLANNFITNKASPIATVSYTVTSTVWYSLAGYLHRYKYNHYKKYSGVHVQVLVVDPRQKHTVGRERVM